MKVAKLEKGEVLIPLWGVVVLSMLGGIALAIGIEVGVEIIGGLLYCNGMF